MTFRPQTDVDFSCKKNLSFLHKLWSTTSVAEKNLTLFHVQLHIDVGCI
jgi:hypothetical protein